MKNTTIVPSRDWKSYIQGPVGPLMSTPHVNAVRLTGRRRRSVRRIERALKPGSDLRMIEHAARKKYPSRVAARLTRPDGEVVRWLWQPASKYDPDQFIAELLLVL